MANIWVFVVGRPGRCRCDALATEWTRSVNQNEVNAYVWKIRSKLATPFSVCLHHSISLSLFVLFYYYYFWLESRTRKKTTTTTAATIYKMCNIEIISSTMRARRAPRNVRILMRNMNECVCVCVCECRRYTKGMHNFNGGAINCMFCRD